VRGLRSFLGLAFLVRLAVVPGFGDPLPVIVDTDMGLDDVRALALRWRLPGVKLRAIVTSDGSASPQAGLKNLRQVLAFLGAGPIPLGRGATLVAL
jgi:inosine-uridine nucleoside N-ribohydrolase